MADIAFERLILVETETFDSATATLSILERDPSDWNWKQAGEGSPVTVGRAGLGWGHTFRHLAKPGEPIKQEGDKRAPAGVFLLGRTFGFGADDAGGYMQLNSGQHFCIDDVNSERYSQIVDPKSVPEGTSGEKMWEIGLYKRGIVVDYPTDRKAKSGSCIFVHIWKSPETPTVGCVAASEETVARLQKWVGEAQNGAVIAIVPKGARDRLGLALPE
ncbi:MAG: hypothetical protein K0U74_06985 [Alphaproteobacteria bacterium]|nr:hypothetical protein [Alphaproteobacteria bacterium]